MDNKQQMEADLFRRMMPRQFAQLTKLCPKCGARVAWQDREKALVCPRCKEAY